MTVSQSHLDSRAELLARIDAGTICAALTVSVGGASRNDIHLFGYLASMVHSQYGHAPSSWGYPFAASSQGLPFAEALEYAIDRMVDSGDLQESVEGYRASDLLTQRTYAAATGAAFAERVALLEDVSNVAVFRALPTIGRAIRSEPQLAKSAKLRAVRLIDEDELAHSLMSLLVAVHGQLDPSFANALPAMIWLDTWEAAREV